MSGSDETSLSREWDVRKDCNSFTVEPVTKTAYVRDRRESWSGQTPSEDRAKVLSISGNCYTSVELLELVFLNFLVLSTTFWCGENVGACYG
jgi:hypothetical protein